MTDAPAFTPGRWFVGDGGVCVDPCPEDGANVVCLEPERVMAASLERWPGNARLIAAAPCMYAYIALQAKSGDEAAIKLLEKAHGR